MRHDDYVQGAEPADRCPPRVTAGLQRLAAVVSNTPDSAYLLISAILDVLAASLDAGTVMLARAGDTALHLDYVRDGAGMGLCGGGTLPLHNSYWTPVLMGASRALAITDTQAEARVHTAARNDEPRIGSCSGVPLRHADGSVYGALCALYATARVIPRDEIALLALAERLIMQAIEAEALRDSTVLLQSEYELIHDVAADAERLRAGYDAVACGVVLQDATGAIVYVNDAAEQIFNVTRDRLQGRTSLDPSWRAVHEDGSDFPGQDHPAMVALRTGQPQRNVTMGLALSNGECRWVQTDAVPLLGEDGQAVQVVVSFTDVTARKQAEEQLAHMAHHDTLTGLPNRALFHDRLAHALAHARRHGQVIALLFLDLDGFKAINDTLGHDVGDALLQAVARRLQACTRDSDTVARLGGDEFMVILPDVAMAGNATVVARKILHELGAGFILASHAVSITSSIGVALYPHDGESIETLTKSADTAMYHAKKDGKNAYRFHTRMRKAG